MSLKARLKRLHADAAWLKYDGRLLLYQRQLELLILQKRYDEAVERQERARERAAQQAAAEAAARVAAEERAARERLERQRAPVRPPEPEMPPVREVEPSPATAPDPSAAPTDVPEDKLVRPIWWRFRGPDDWEDEDDVPAVLTEYDPLAEEDSS